MSTLPPALAYLTVYNPTLAPAAGAADDDEDVAEQAHILFYTARERAVSRDRILRQVGLAKALVNFSSMFGDVEETTNIHSNTRRIVVFSPEPDFYIHACLELAKTPRAPRVRPADKKAQDKKTPTQGKPHPPTETWGYHEGSVDDCALRTHLEHGYAIFKLTHGTFASVLATLGQQALELQLERFFTVWAWKWDVEDGFELGTLLGVPLHPHLTVLQPALDAAGFQLADGDAHLILAPPYVLPSARAVDAGLPISLSRHLLSRVSSGGMGMRPPLHARASSHPMLRPHAPRSVSMVTVDTDLRTPAPANTVSPVSQETSTQPGPSRLLEMTMDVVDVRRWNWGALTFKGPAKKPADGLPASDSAAAHNEDKAPPSVAVVADGMPVTEHAPMDAKVKTAAGSEPVESAVQEALSSTVANSERRDLESTPTLSVSLSDTTEPAPDVTPTIAAPTEMEPQEPEPAEPLPPVYSTTIWLDNPTAEHGIARRRVLFLSKDDLTFVVVRGDDEDLNDARRAALAELVVPLLGTLDSIIRAEARRQQEEALPPSAATILGAKDQHLFIRSDGTSSGTLGFASTSEHLFNARQLLETHGDVLEVFSRGQQPQHWHAVRRGTHGGMHGQSQHEQQDDVYLEVLRKEASLTDVDNVLATLGRNRVHGL